MLLKIKDLPVAALTVRATQKKLVQQIIGFHPKNGEVALWCGPRSLNLLIVHILIVAGSQSSLSIDISPSSTIHKALFLGLGSSDLKVGNPEERRKAFDQTR